MPILPGVIGLSLTQAQSALISVGLNGGRVGSMFSSTVAAGLVAHSSPLEGADLPEGANVFLWESDGPDTTGPQVPDVRGLIADVAANNLNAAGYLVQFQSVSDEIVQFGCVVETVPEAGAPLPFPATVTVLISSGPLHPIPSSPDPIPTPKTIPVDLRTAALSLHAGPRQDELATAHVCDLMAQAIRDLERELADLIDALSRLDSMIAVLTSGPVTKPETLAALQAERDRQASKLESAQSNLVAWREEYSASCP